MELFRGILQKMQVTQASPIVYQLKGNDSPFEISKYIGQSVRLQFTGRIECLKCQRKINKTYQDGYCYPCFISAAECTECIIFPERCQAHLGLGRDLAWEKENHNQPHVVYLAVSSGLKIGITRASNVVNRWIDQGASHATVLVQTPHRYLSGCIEVALKAHYSDKTVWQRMLKNEILQNFDPTQEKQKALSYIPTELWSAVQEDVSDWVTLHYPVLNYPSKVVTLKPDDVLKQGVAASWDLTLLGIKGQYLLTDQGVINIRKYGGYEVVIALL